jgi:hypothetical protein
MAVLTSAVRAATWLVLAVAVAPAPARGFAQGTLETEIKAVFLYNFAKYVNWPPAPPGSSESIRICAPNHPALLTLVRAAVQGESIDGRPLRAVELDGLDGARDCHIIFVGEASTADAAAWITAVRGWPTLVVADGRLANGVAIAFVRDNNRVRFDINRAAAKKQNLDVSSKLLRLARRIEDP